MDSIASLEIDEVPEDFGLKNYDISSSPNDFNISTLCNLIEQGVVQIPVFQRNYVWDINRASKLIESIIMGLPIPQLFLYEKTKNQYLVIDGQQRLLSIYFFFKGKFPNDMGRQKLRGLVVDQNKIPDSLLEDPNYFSEFKLKLPKLVESQDNPLNKLSFNTLGDYAHTFQFLRTIRCIMIKQNSPDDESSMFEIFNRLNTGGYNLTQQEIRMSLFYSPLYDRIIKINTDPRWRRLTGQSSPDLHFKDVEIILRSFAMLEEHESYKAPMTKFLNNYSKMSRNKSESELDELISIFKLFLKQCDNLNEVSFKMKNGKFSISLFEAVFVAVCEKIRNHPTQQLILSDDVLRRLRADSDFINATSTGIASASNVKLRISSAKRVLNDQ